MSDRFIVIRPDCLLQSCANVADCCPAGMQAGDAAQQLKNQRNVSFVPTGRTLFLADIGNASNAGPKVLVVLATMSLR